MRACGGRRSERQGICVCVVFAGGGCVRGVIGRRWLMKRRTDSFIVHTCKLLQLGSFIISFMFDGAGKFCRYIGL
jgi:hypothetical protein